MKGESAMKFGDNLKQIRKSKKISQEDLADKLGVSRQSVSKWETGENYPSMQNIVCLCDIFKCKMNDLVHESFEDIDFMDKEIKMSVVKLNEKEQNRMKVLSKILYLIGRIGKIVCRVGIGFIIAAMVLLPIVLSKIEVKDDTLVADGNVVRILESVDGVKITVNNDHIILSDLTKENVATLKESLTRFNKTVLITLYELSFVVLIGFVVVVIQLLKHLEKLFVNINEGETPFTLENVSHIKKMSYFMIAAIIVSSIGGTLLSIVTSTEVNIDFNLFNVGEIIFLYAMAYIFEYGYKIQMDSKGVMYNK
jgi:transcriptional regulator with XRE-family HTH domain